ncbi:MAG TPA: hypothetical protein ENG51_12075 [Deltaproteobacteria bacterium]|nr:hypothetical protein [Deltaproteobacteria bacterium]
MKARHIYLLYSLSIAFLVCFLLQISSVGYAITTAEISDHAGIRAQDALHGLHTQASFLAWRGERLITTAGVFVIDKSVKVIDRAGSRDLKPGFKGSPPSVKLILQGRKLIKVVIE